MKDVRAAGVVGGNRMIKGNPEEEMSVDISTSTRLIGFLFVSGFVLFCFLRLVMFCEVKKDIHGTWTFSIQYCGQLLHTSLTQSNAFAS